MIPKRTTSATARCIWKCDPFGNTGCLTRARTHANRPCAFTDVTVGAGGYGTWPGERFTRRICCPVWNCGSTHALEYRTTKHPYQTGSLPMPDTDAPLLSPAFLNRLEQLELVSRKIFMGRMKGERLSKRKGQSVEFADFRPYVV